MKVTEEGIEIYFSDLNDDAQRMFLSVLHIHEDINCIFYVAPNACNFDIVPIAIVSIPEK